MTSPTFPNVARLGLAAVAAACLAGCAHVRGDYDPYGYDSHYYDAYPYPASRVAYYDYWYYPALDCYYDSRARIYIYYEHDRWVRARALPPHLRPHLGRHVIVRAPHDRPYEHHNWHREQHAPGHYMKAPEVRRDATQGGPSRKELPLRNRDGQRHAVPYRDRERDTDGMASSRDHNNDRAPVGTRKQPPAQNGIRLHEPASRPHKPNARFEPEPRRREAAADAAPIGRKPNASGSGTRNAQTQSSERSDGVERRHKGRDESGDEMGPRNSAPAPGRRSEPKSADLPGQSGS